MELDPRTISASTIVGTVKASDQPSLPEKIRQLGFILDQRKMFPGDLVLMRPIAAADKFGRLTKDVQRRQYTANNEWTHAAIYYQDWLVIEATPENNVSTNNLLPLMASHVFMVRRGRYINEELIAGNIDSARAVGLTIALEAALMQNSARYGFGTAAAIWLEAMGVKLWPRNEIAKRSIICSGLYVKCYHIATGRSLLNATMLRSEEAITPALLANTADMVTIDVGWCALQA